MFDSNFWKRIKEHHVGKKVHQGGSNLQGPKKTTKQKKNNTKKTLAYKIEKAR